MILYITVNISIYQYDFVQEGFRSKSYSFYGFFCLTIPKIDHETKETPPNIDVIVLKAS